MKWVNGIKVVRLGGAAKCFLYECESLSSTSRAHIKICAWWVMHRVPVLGRQSQEDAWGLITSLFSLIGGLFQNRWGAIEGDI